MDSLFSNISSLLALFSLRCFLPLVVTLSVSWLLKRWLKCIDIPSAMSPAIGPKPSDSQPHP